jgi:hypothetical protein
MLVYAFARRVAIAIVAILIATSGGSPSAHADAHKQPGVERLWSKFPLGPRLQIHRSSQTRHRAAQPPVTSTTTGTGATSPHVPAAEPTRGRRVPPWVWPLMVVPVLAVASAALWLSRRRRGTGEPEVRPVTREQPPPPSPMRAEPIEASVATPQETHPWKSGGPRSLETLPRRDLFEIANVLGIQDAVLMSREELIEALRSRGPVAGTPPSAASDLELARYAAAYTAACRSGNPAPILVVSAVAAPMTEDPAGYSKRLIAEAQRRGLLTSCGGGKPGGELTAQSKSLLRKARDHPPSTRR